MNSTLKEIMYSGLHPLAFEQPINQNLFKVLKEVVDQYSWM